MIDVPPQFVPIIQQAARETGVPFNVLAAKIRQESNFRPDARGAAGEIGISQVMPATARQPGYGLSPIELAALSDPAQAIPWGARYLAARAGRVDWNDPQQAAAALARYNGAGPAARAYGRQVARMAGMVVPPEPPTADGGDAPVRRQPQRLMEGLGEGAEGADRKPSKQLGPSIFDLPEEDEDTRLQREVQAALRLGAWMTGGY